MQRIERTGKTVEEAVAEGLRELKAKREQVEIEVLEEPTRGILGLLSKPAKVRLTVKETVADKTRSFIMGIIAAMEVDAEVTVAEKDDILAVEIEGSQLGVLIGRRGETLDSMQYLVNLAMNHTQEKMKRIVIDIEGYRNRREKSLRELAGIMADKARQRGRSIVLEPMSALERRIIHTELQGLDDIDTLSEGEEPFRKVVITPRSGRGKL